MPKSLHVALEELAKNRKVSVEQFILPRLQISLQDIVRSLNGENEND